MIAIAEADDLVDADRYRALTADKRAFRVGDTITILILEQSSAESQANTGRSRGFEIQGDAFDSENSVEVGASLDSTSRGDAVTRRRGTLRGRITATVVSLTGMDHLLVEGQQVLVINGEEQSINVAGTLRTEDIDSDNTVLSNRLTNARIEFTGQGIVSDAQKPGLITRFLRFLGLN
jgi:flagellar L-ring protein precursor FlgH